MKVSTDGGARLGEHAVKAVKIRQLEIDKLQSDDCAARNSKCQIFS
jgi:hypothetical protein